MELMYRILSITIVALIFISIIIGKKNNKAVNPLISESADWLILFLLTVSMISIAAVRVLGLL